jgi:hypothetical protein
MDDTRFDDVCAAYYEQWPDGAKYQHCPTFYDCVPTVQERIRQTVRMVLTALTATTTITTKQSPPRKGR